MFRTLTHTYSFLKNTLRFSLCLLCFGGSAQTGEVNLLQKLNTTHNVSADKFFIGVTHSATPVSIVLPTSFFSVGLINKNEELKFKSYEQASALAISSLLSLGLKYGIKRERPYEKYPGITRKVNEHTFSFPSGHTTTAFAAATTLTLQYPKWKVAIPAYVWATAVSYSRLRLGVHYPTDVFAGIIIGTGTSVLTHFIFKKNNWAAGNP